MKNMNVANPCGRKLYGLIFALICVIGLVAAYMPFKPDAKSAFNEVLVANIHPLFQGSFEYTVNNTDLNTNLTRNSGSVVQLSGMASVGTGITADSTALLRSKQHGRYRAGFGGVSRFTALYGTPTAGTEQYVGIADGTSTTGTFENGYMVGYDGTTFGFHRWQNNGTTTVTQANWDDPQDWRMSSETFRLFPV